MAPGPSQPDFRGSATVVVDGEILVSTGDDIRQIVASVSKQFIAAAVLLADAEGMLRLADHAVGQRAWFHPGDNPGFSAFAGYLPDARISVGVVSAEQDTDVMRSAADVVRSLDQA